MSRNFKELRKKMKVNPLDMPLPKELKEWELKYNAPKGQIWVCGGCGKSNNCRTRIGDESCFLNAVLCWEKEKFGDVWDAVVVEGE